jgi:CheY-like chemotaxis protein
MAKILLVEDDKNLQEIYAAQLSAEGHTIVSAYDGEQGLSLAASEHPDLIITDAMMPRVSGLQFLDILRSTPATANIKVIAMTALSQADDRAQFEKLGVERFLVKSQVTLEDVARVVNEVLNPSSTPEANLSVGVATANEPTAQSAPAQGGQVDAVEANMMQAPVVMPMQTPVDSSSFSQQPVVAASMADEQSDMMQQIESFVETSPVINTQPLQVTPQPDPVVSLDGMSAAPVQQASSTSPADDTESADNTTLDPVLAVEPAQQPTTPPATPNPAATPAPAATQVAATSDLLDVAL